MSPTKPKTREQLHAEYDRKVKQLERAQKKYDYVSDRVRNMDQMYAELDRRSRTHRLCCRAGMLEKQLRDPELLTNEQVDSLLKLAFAHDDVQDMMRIMLVEAYEHPEMVQL